MGGKHFGPKIVVKCTGTKRPEKPTKTQTYLGAQASVNILSELPNQSYQGEALASRSSGESKRALGAEHPEHPGTSESVKKHGLVIDLPE